MAIGGMVAAGATVAQTVKMITVESLKWVALKLLVWTTVVFVLPAVIYAFLLEIMDEIITWMMATVTGQGIESSVVALAGMGGWAAQHARVPEAASIILSAVAVRFLLNIAGLRP